MLINDVNVIPRHIFLPLNQYGRPNIKPKFYRTKK